MHEYSIVQSLLVSCEENAVKNKATKVTKVVIKIGVMSGVEPELIRTAFETFKEDTICEEAEFIINIQAVVIRCKDCFNEQILEGMEYYCPKCKSPNLKVLDGEDMFLMQLELE